MADDLELAPWESAGGPTEDAPWEQEAAPSRGVMGYAGDIAKGVGHGLARGVELAATAVPRVANFAGEMLEKVPGMAPTPEQASQRQQLRDLTEPARDVVPKYVPQAETLPGKFAQTAAEFVPGTVGALKGSVARGVGIGAASGAASETGGQAAEALGADPTTEAVVRAITPLPVAGLASIPKRVPATAPASQELKKISSELFKAPEVAEVRIAAPAVSRGLSSIKSELEQTIDPAMMKETWARLGAEEALHATEPAGKMSALTKVGPTVKGDVSVKDLSTLREELGEIAQTFSPNRSGKDRLAATVAIGKIDDFLAGIKQPDLTAGNAALASKLIQDARGNYAAAMRGQTMEILMENATLKAGGANSGRNFNNALRQEFKALTLRPKKGRGGKSLAQQMGFSPSEIAQMKKVTHGTWTGNRARNVANLLQGNIAGVALLGGGVGQSLYSQDPSYLAAAAGLRGVGHGARRIGEASTTRQANLASEMTRGRSPLARQTGVKPYTPRSLEGTKSAIINAVTGAGGFRKGGRVTRTFKYQHGGGVEGGTGNEWLNAPAAEGPPPPPPSDSYVPPSPQPAPPMGGRFSGPSSFQGGINDVNAGRATIGGQPISPELDPYQEGFDRSQLLTRFGSTGQAISQSDRQNRVGFAPDYYQSLMKHFFPHMGYRKGGRVAKLSKQAVNYGRGMPRSHCGVCRFYHNKTCDKVDGSIDSAAWCRLFKRRE